MAATATFQVAIEPESVKVSITSDRLEGCTLVVAATDEGLILDLFDRHGDVVGTQGMMYDEWANWVMALDDGDGDETKAVFT